MSRWEPNARGRLREAALALYGERGFEQVTVAEIAQRAGLTERTFFRYFADKREVLFSGSDELQELLMDAVADAPESAVPIEVVAKALEQACAMFQERRQSVRRRQSIIAANAELRERELIKLAALTTALADALRKRGVGDPIAGLAAEMGMAVFKIAFDRWVNDPEPSDLPLVMRELLNEAKAVTVGAS